MCDDKNIVIGQSVLRHLIANSDAYGQAEGKLAESVAFLAGHSKETEERVYKNKTPTSRDLTNALQWCHDAQQARMLGELLRLSFEPPSLFCRFVVLVVRNLVVGGA